MSGEEAAASGKGRRRLLYVLFGGCCMGTADLIPGVSGSTMAYALGFYPRLVRALAGLIPVRGSRCRRWLAGIEWDFLVPLALGMLLAAVALLYVFDLPDLMRRHPQRLHALFFGLVLGAVLMTLTQLPQRTAGTYVAIGAGLAAGLLAFPSQAAAPAETVSAGLLLLTGAFAGAAMLVPGISGSYLLLVLGKYEFVLAAVANLEVLVLLPFGTGVLCGLLTLARILHLLLQRSRFAMPFIGGLLLASLPQIWPFRETAAAGGAAGAQLQLPDLFYGEHQLAALLMGAGLAAILQLHRAAAAAGNRN